MSGTHLGYLKGKLGLRGETKPGEMLTRLNLKMKSHSSSALKGLEKFVKEEKNEKKKPMKKNKLGLSKEPKEYLKYFKCKSCGAMYKSSSALSSHMKSHKK